jgi:hypothetical protein
MLMILQFSSRIPTKSPFKKHEAFGKYLRATVKLDLSKETTCIGPTDKGFDEIPR